MSFDGKETLTKVMDVFVMMQAYCGVHERWGGEGSIFRGPCSAPRSGYSFHLVAHTCIEVAARLASLFSFNVQGTYRPKRRAR